MKQKKILSLILASLMSLSLLAACSPSTAKETTKEATQAVTSAMTSEDKSETSKTVAETSGGTTGLQGTVKVAAIETAYGVEMWQKVAKAFEDLYPGVTVDLLTDPQLEEVIGPGMKAGDYPDVVHLGLGREMALTETFIKENAMEDITSVLDMKVPGEAVLVKDKIVPGFTDTSLTNPYNDGKTYLAPMFFGPTGLFYNAGLFREKGWEIPTTWEEMWALGDKAQAEKISLFTYPTTGYFDTFFYALMFEAGGVDFFEKATTYTEGIWETPEAKAALDIVGTLATKYTESSTVANATDSNYLKNQQLILDNKALFMPNGTWVVGEMKDAPRTDEFDWGFMPLPAIADGDRYSYTWFEQAWIPAGAENKELAKEFVAFLYSDEAAKLFAQSNAIQPIVGISEQLTGENEIYYKVYEEGAKAALGGFATTDPVEGVEVRAVWFDPINSLVSGDKTQKDWVAGIIKANDQLRAALK